MIAHDRSRDSLFVALTASLVIHASLGSMLGMRFVAVRPNPADADSTLLVRIANEPASRIAAPRELPASAAPTVEAMGSTTLPSRPSELLTTDTGQQTALREIAAMAPSALPHPAASAPATHFRGRVSVSPGVALVLAGDYLEGRSHAEFPAEVKDPVRLAEPIVVEYPETALRDHREGTVVAWMIVSASGQITEIDFRESDDDFATAVSDALGKARLLPARIDDKPIPFYTVLEFNFHIDRDSGASTASAAQTTPR